MGAGAGAAANKVGKFDDVLPPHPDNRGRQQSKVNAKLGVLFFISILIFIILIIEKALHKLVTTSKEHKFCSNKFY